MHINEEVIDPESNRIDPHKIDLMGRMGRSYYVRASGEAIHSIYQPVLPITIGYDALPDFVKASEVLTANEIAILASCHALPSKEQIQKLKHDFNGSKKDQYAAIRSLILSGKKEDALALSFVD